jgi:hypothetical protein
MITVIPEFAFLTVFLETGSKNEYGVIFLQEEIFLPSVTVSKISASFFLTQNMKVYLTKLFL